MNMHLTSLKFNFILVSFDTWANTTKYTQMIYERFVMILNFFWCHVQNLLNKNLIIDICYNCPHFPSRYIPSYCLAINMTIFFQLQKTWVGGVERRSLQIISCKKLFLAFTWKTKPSELQIKQQHKKKHNSSNLKIYVIV